MKKAKHSFDNKSFDHENLSDKILNFSLINKTCFKDCIISNTLFKESQIFDSTFKIVIYQK